MRLQVIRTGLAAILCLLGLGATPAAATFHLIQVRELYPGSAAAPGAEYVELQMWSGKQHFVAGHFVRSYGPTGAAIATSFFPADVANGANQSTLVLATPEAESQFGFVADAPLSPAGQLSPLGGALCWEEIDCVSWGNFSGSLPSPAGAPAAPGGIPDGMAIRRSIAAGCPTLLEFGDDHDNSAGDFEAVSPLPRPNSVAPSERSCAGPDPGAGAPAHADHAPQTILRRKPPKRTRDRTPTFRFGSDPAGARFECKVDRRAYRRCRSPFTTRRLALGPHRFQVRARAHDGAVDPSPAGYRFKVIPARG